MMAAAILGSCKSIASSCRNSVSGPYPERVDIALPMGTGFVCQWTISRVLLLLCTGMMTSDSWRRCLDQREFADAFQKYQNATGAVVDPATQFLKINAAQYDQLQSLMFNIGGVRADCARLRAMYAVAYFVPADQL